MLVIALCLHRLYFIKRDMMKNINELSLFHSLIEHIFAFFRVLVKKYLEFFLSLSRSEEPLRKCENTDLVENDHNELII